MNDSTHDLFAQIDRVPVPDQWDDIVSSAEQHDLDPDRPSKPISASDGRNTEVFSFEELHELRNDQVSGDRRIWMFSAAAALALIAFALVVLPDDSATTSDAVASEPVEVFEGSGTQGSGVPEDAPFGLTESTTTTEPVTAEEALALVDRYLELGAAGNFDGLRTLTSYDTFGEVDQYQVDRELASIAWDRGQGSVYSDQTCEVVAEDPAAGVDVQCMRTYQQQIRELVGAAPVATTEWFRVTPDRVWSVFSNPGLATGSALAEVDDPFQEWMAAHYSEFAETTDCCAGGIDTAVAALRGETRLEYGRLWAAYLQENGCTFDQPCEPGG